MHFSHFFAFAQFFGFPPSSVITVNFCFCFLLNLEMFENFAPVLASYVASIVLIFFHFRSSSPKVTPDNQHPSDDNRFFL